jgi:hypothetical protein
MPLVETGRTLRKRLAHPVGTIVRVAAITFVLAAILLVAGVSWFVYVLTAGTVRLDLFAQLLIIAGLCALVAITLVAARVALVTRVVQRMLS